MPRPCRCDWRTLGVDGLRRRRPLKVAPKVTHQGAQPHGEAMLVALGGQHLKSVSPIYGSFV